MYRLSGSRLVKGGIAICFAVAALTLAAGCARDVLSVDFASKESVDMTTDRQTLLIVGAGFDKTSEVVLEMDGIAPMPLQTKFNTTSMLEATLSRVDIGGALQTGIRYSASVCVQNHGAKACSDKPLLVTVVPDGDRRVVAKAGVTDSVTGPASNGGGPDGGTEPANAFDSTSGTPGPVPEGDERSLATSAIVTNDPYSAIATPTTGTVPGGQASLTPVPTPTFTSVPTATPTPAPTPTRTPVPGKDVAYLIGGVLNGIQVDSADPIVSVRPGEAIYGSIRVAVRTIGGHGDIFPLGATYSWSNPETGYWQVSGSVPSASFIEYTVRISTMAPSRPGEYFIVVAGAAEYSLAHVMSSTRWDAGIPRWDDGDDVTGWDEAAIQSAIRDGYVTAPCYPAAYCDFVATAVVVRVGE